MTGANMNPQLSRIEDEARMHELRELFALLEEKNLHTTSSNEKAHSINETLERALSILSWDDFEDDTQAIAVVIHRNWLKVLQYVMPYLRSVLSPKDISLLSKLKQALTKYAEIKHPNHLVVIQPKLQLINTIEA
ncbi:hypothetical protein KWE70_18830 [Acinetobacter pittii]|nr:hypothetical protein [Acinetobacter nosocomialis]MBJ8485400.1 hypothetical protein [Acinetobacter pittii]MBJ8494800.1 hypothetical protein [Acinetobacter nosocomialis]MBJ9725560.1 hypothetical protein [Acinetobacter nosocomialis]MBZ6528897.1 hypothetical protein [Acinetobacter nosocomialis]